MSGRARGLHIRHALAPLIFACIAPPVFAGGLAIVETELRDNGDHDGYDERTGM